MEVPQLRVRFISRAQDKGTARGPILDQIESNLKWRNFLCGDLSSFFRGANCLFRPTAHLMEGHVENAHWTQSSSQTVIGIQPLGMGENFPCDVRGRKQSEKKQAVVPDRLVIGKKIQLTVHRIDLKGAHCSTSRSRARSVRREFVSVSARESR